MSAAPALRGASERALGSARSLVHATPSLPSALVRAANAITVAEPSDLDRASLQRRFDHKYLLPVDAAADLVEAIAPRYRVALAAGARFAEYDTVYFDTPELACFHDHRRRRKPRCKVRIRHYVDRGFSVLELKTKTARGDTDKRRWSRDGVSFVLSDQERALLAEAAPALAAKGPLAPQARTRFFRLMLVSTGSVERATLDFDLTLERDGRSRAVDFVVVEVKDGGRGAPSPLVLALRAARAKQRSFSKYSVAVATLSSQRITTLKPLVNLVDRGLR